LTAYRVTEYFIGTGTRKREREREEEEEFAWSFGGALSERFHVKLGTEMELRGCKTAREEFRD